MTQDRELAISLSPGEVRWAVREDGAVVALGAARQTDGPQPGDLILARVRAVVPAANAAFLDLGGGHDGFLSGRDARRKLAPGFEATVPSGERDDIAGLVTEGEALLVQVKRAALGDKAAQVTAAVVLAGWRLVLTPGRPGIRISRRITEPAERERLTGMAEAILAAWPEGLGLILRTSAARCEAEVLEQEARHLAARWNTVREAAAKAKAPASIDVAPTPLAAVLRACLDAQPARILLDSPAGLAAARAGLAALAPELVRLAEASGDGEQPLFEAEGIEDAFDAALAREVALPGGGSLIVEPTAALIAIDVNTGERGGKQSRAILETNLAAAKAVAEQFRLRNLAGLIVVDFVRMRSRDDRARVSEALRDAMAEAAPDAEIGGFTRFGLVEIVRPRERPALHEVLGEPVPGGAWRVSAETVALAALRAVLRAAVAHKGRNLRLCAGPSAIAALTGALKPAHAEAEAALGLSIELSADPTFGHEGFDISPL